MRRGAKNQIQWQERLLYVDARLVIVDKPDGVLSQKDKSGDPDLADLLREFWKAAGEKADFLAPVHRLDRNTSGALILARDSAAAAAFGKMLRDRKVQRTYLAVVKGDPGNSGTIDAPLAKDESENKSEVSEKGEKAITHYRRLKKLAATSIVEATLETGRSHQIRAHFAHIRCPILGDRKYAKAPWNSIFQRPALHARRVEFKHPFLNRDFKVEAPIPEDIEDLIRQMGG